MTRVEVWIDRYDTMHTHWNNVCDWFSKNSNENELLTVYLRDEWHAIVIGETDKHISGIVSHLEFETDEAATLYLLRWA